MIWSTPQTHVFVICKSPCGHANADTTSHAPKRMPTLIAAREPLMPGLVEGAFMMQPPTRGQACRVPEGVICPNERRSRRTTARARADHAGARTPQRAHVGAGTSSR